MIFYILYNLCALCQIPSFIVYSFTGFQKCPIADATTSPTTRPTAYNVDSTSEINTARARVRVRACVRECMRDLLSVCMRARVCVLARG